jgi:hypothetical protein
MIARLSRQSSVLVDVITRMNLKLLGAGFIGLCAALALLIAPAQSHAYSRFGTKWPGGKITYYNSVKSYDPAVRAAVSAWNHSGAKVKFKRVSKKKARVRIGYMKDNTCRGLTRLPRAKRTTRARVYLPAPSSSEFCQDTATVTIVAAHELGHVLGLDHETRECATMNPQGNRAGGTLCAEPGGTPPWLWRCRILEPDDVRGAVKIYGGKFSLSKFKASPLCPLYADPPPVVGLTAADSGATNKIQISMTRPADGVVPGYLARQFAGGTPFSYVAYAAGACPAITAATAYSWGSVPVGGALSGTINSPSLTPGTYCVSIWSADAIGRPSAPALASVTIS